MVKATPVIMIMFSVIILASILVAISSYYGADWTWMGNQVAGLFLLIMVLGIAVYTLMGWLKRR